MPLHHTAYLCLRAPPSPALLSPQPYPRRLLQTSLASMFHAQPATTRLRRTAALPGAPRPLFPRPTSRPGHLPARASPMDLVRHEAGLQSTRLDPRLREAVERVVETLGGRVTVRPPHNPKQGQRRAERGIGIKIEQWGAGKS